MIANNIFQLATWHWHIEISSKCTLKCPRCARQEVPDGLVNTELSLEFFQQAFPPEFIKDNVRKITFCGDDGDPIYAHDLIDVIKYFKSAYDVEFVIVTNGSYKKPSWWKELGETLSERDSVHFSIDGFDNASNNIYRVNSDYDSIIAGLKSLRAASPCQIVWATIGFQFNENHIKSMIQTAKDLGADRFQLTKSTKFGCVYPAYGNNDALQPSIKFVSKTHRFEREITDFTGRHTNVHPINFTKILSTQEFNGIKPLCGIGNKGLYIASSGKLYPCCWTANRYSHNSEWKVLANRFDLHTRTIPDVLNDKFWSTEFTSFRWNECNTKCSSAVMDENYMTAW